MPSHTKPAANEPNPLEGSHSYCTRLAHIINTTPVDQLVFNPFQPTHGTPHDPLIALPIDPTTLSMNPRLQVLLASAAAYTPSKWLLEQELSLRENNPGPSPHWASAREPFLTARQGTSSWSASSGDDVFDAAARQNLSGLCFSGGGIRSATFCLGVLQALASKQKLRRFDYLSSVSGGGYIHQWFASWVLREPGGFTKVNRSLIPLPDENSPARAPEEISWLRRYSNYLTPQKGFLSADTWTMAAIWFRNTFLNQIVLFAFFGLIILTGRGVTHGLLPGGQSLFCSSPANVPGLLIWLLGIASAAVCVVLGRALYSVTQPQQNHIPRGALTDLGVNLLLVIPGFLFAYLLSADKLRTLSAAYYRLHFFGYACVPSAIFICWAAYVLGLLVAITYWGRAPQEVGTLKSAPLRYSIVAGFLLGVSALACAALSVFLVHHSSIWLLQHPLFRTHPSASADFRAIALPIVLFSLQFLAIRLQLGIIGRFYAESRREWLSRYGGWSAIVSIAWIAVTSIARLGPPLFQWCQRMGRKELAAVGLSTILVHAATLLAGNSSKSDGKPDPNKFFGYSAMDIVGMIGAPLCILLLMVIVSTGVESAYAAMGPGTSLMHYFYFFLIILTIFLFFGWRVDVNDFSMHGFYRNRLARCYLGATRRNRKPDPFTGFDDHDTASHGIAMADLLPANYDPLPGTIFHKGRYTGPFPIFCSTINLSYGEDLGAQERKGASFAFTPLYSGYHVGWTGETGHTNDTTYVGYAPTEQYAYMERGIKLSTVTAICGAALSPNQGYSTQPALAFLMTLFNARLGWWLANPRRPGIWPCTHKFPTPAFGLRYLLSELFGLADDTSNYVCLCDGGHFENMGLYELVRRRTALIVICDAEEDTTTVFEGIGLAISKCRTDFGAEITLDLTPMLPDPATGHARQHFQVGTIQYTPPASSKLDPKDFLGKVIYLKTSITGDETADILHYRRAFPNFPQDSTLNQWFTETQFESYRRLGQLIGEQVSAFI